MNNWKRIKNNLDDLSILKGDFLKEQDSIQILRKAFSSASETTYALRFLLFFINDDDFGILKCLIKELVSTAIDGSPTNIFISRKVISQIDKMWLYENIDFYLKEEVKINNDDWVNRRIAELLIYLDLKENLKRHLSNCEKDPNPDIREISQDFSCE